MAEKLHKLNMKTIYLYSKAEVDSCRLSCSINFKGITRYKEDKKQFKNRPSKGPAMAESESASN